MPDIGSFLNKAWMEFGSHEGLSITIVICITILLALAMIFRFFLKLVEKTDLREIEAKSKDTHIRARMGPPPNVEHAAVTSQAYLESLKLLEPEAVVFDTRGLLQKPPPPALGRLSAAPSIYSIEQQGRLAKNRRRIS